MKCKICGVMPLVNGECPECLKIPKCPLCKDLFGDDNSDVFAKPILVFGIRLCNRCALKQTQRFIAQQLERAQRIQDEFVCAIDKVLTQIPKQKKHKKISVKEVEENKKFLEEIAESNLISKENIKILKKEYLNES